MKLRRKTGERPQTRQPLKIDRLPQKLRDRILYEYNTNGRTWEEIEQDSPSWKEWNEAPPEVQVLFEGRRLPHTNLHRWYDLRVEQVQRDVIAGAAQAREIAKVFAKATVTGADESVLNAARDLIFTILQQQNDTNSKGFAAKALIALGEVMQSARANAIKERKVAAEERRVVLLEKDAELKRKRLEKETEDAAKKLSKGELTVEDINRLRERTFGLPPIQQRSA